MLHSLCSVLVCCIPHATADALNMLSFGYYCLAGDVQLAIEFLLLAGQWDQAFDLAAAKAQLESFGQLAAASIKVCLGMPT